MRYDRPNNGGKRRRHVAPALDSEKLKIVAQMRSAGSSLRVIGAELGVNATTIGNVVNHRGAYQGSGI